MNRLLFLVFIIFAGCATMQRGLVQPVAFESEPTGATVTFQGKTCVTPCVIEATRGFKPESLEIKLAEESYQGEITSSVTEEMNALIPGLVAGAVLIFPLVVDQSSGVLQDWPKKIIATFPNNRGAMVKIQR